MAVGGLVDLAGTLRGASAQEKRRKELYQIADTPGIDTRATATDSINDILFNLPRAAEATAKSDAANQASLDAILEAIVPGYKATQAKRASNSSALINGQLPPDVAAQVQRQAAAKGVRGGYGGSRFGDNLTLRDLGLTTLDAQQIGSRMWQEQVSGTPRVATHDSIDYAGLSPQQLIALRSAERYDRLDRKTYATLNPTGKEINAQGMVNAGNRLYGTGAGLLGSQGGGQDNSYASRGSQASGYEGSYSGGGGGRGGRNSYDYMGGDSGE